MIAAVIQTQGSPDRERNWQASAELIEEAAARQAKLVVLPEYFGFLRASGHDPMLAEPLKGPTFKFLSGLAARLKIWIVGGSFYQKGRNHKIYNTCLLLDEHGNMVDYYHKIHLVTSSGGRHHPFSEETYLSHGHRQRVCASPVGRLGMAICYDLRFPEATRGLRLRGAQVVAAPSAFFVSPGERQWEAIIRTRAIENQCYMLVGAQWGEYAPRRSALGFSMIVDPLGDVLAKCEPGVGIALANIDPAWVDKCRADIDYLGQARMLPKKIRITSG